MDDVVNVFDSMDKTDDKFCICDSALHIGSTYYYYKVHTMKGYLPKNNVKGSTSITLWTKFKVCIYVKLRWTIIN